MTSAERLVQNLNTGRYAPAVGVDRAKILPGLGNLRIQVSVRLVPKKATLFDAVEQTINLAAESNLLTCGLERVSGETFILTLVEEQP